MKWADGSASTIALRVLNLPNGTTSAVVSPTHSMYRGFQYSASGTTATVELTGLPRGSYDVYLYGKAGARHTGFSITVHATATGAALLSTATLHTAAIADAASFQEGNQYVSFSDVLIDSGQLLRVHLSNGTQGSGAGGIVLNGIQLVRTHLTH